MSWNFSDLPVYYIMRVHFKDDLRIESLHYYYTALRKSPVPPAAIRWAVKILFLKTLQIYLTTQIRRRWNTTCEFVK